MDLVLYQMEICLKSMRKNVKLNLVVVISLCVGMMVPLIALADIQYFFEYGDTSRPAFMDSAVRFYSVSSKLDARHVYEALSGDSLFAKIAVVESGRWEVECDGQAFYETVYVASAEIFEFYPPCVVAGRSLEKEDFTGEVRNCLVEENFFQDNMLEGNPGDTLMIDGEEYTVVGICRKIDSRGGIWIPFRQMSQKRDAQGIEVFVQYLEGVEFAEVKERVRQLLGNIISVDTLGQMYRMERSQGMRLCLSILLMIFPLIAFSIINCFAVIQGKLRRMRHQFAVELAYGAKKRDIFGSCLFENFVLCGFALVLDNLLLPFMIPHVPAGVEMVWTLGVYLEMLLLMFLVCLVLGWLSTRSILKLSPAKILKGE